MLTRNEWADLWKWVKQTRDPERQKKGKVVKRRGRKRKTVRQTEPKTQKDWERLRKRKRLAFRLAGTESNCSDFINIHKAGMEEAGGVRWGSGHLQRPRQSKVAGVKGLSVHSGLSRDMELSKFCAEAISLERWGHHQMSIDIRHPIHLIWFIPIWGSNSEARCSDTVNFEYSGSLGISSSL